jgi:hypothetical protein
MSRIRLSASRLVKRVSVVSRNVETIVLAIENMNDALIQSVDGISLIVQAVGDLTDAVSSMQTSVEALDIQGAVEAGVYTMLFEDHYPSPFQTSSLAGKLFDIQQELDGSYYIDADGRTEETARISFKEFMMRTSARLDYLVFAANESDGVNRTDLEGLSNVGQPFGTGVGSWDEKWYQDDWSEEDHSRLKGIKTVLDAIENDTSYLDDIDSATTQTNLSVGALNIATVAQIGIMVDNLVKQKLAIVAAIINQGDSSPWTDTHDRLDEVEALIAESPEGVVRTSHDDSKI